MIPGAIVNLSGCPRINVDYGVYVLPDQVSYLEGTMIEPLACGVRGLGLIDIRSHHTVLILGCGISGILNIQLAKLTGARVIATDINEYRLKKATEFGADQVRHGAQDLNLKADRVIVCTGAYATVEQAFRCVEKKGIILFFAIPNRDIAIPIPDFWRNELTVTSSYGAAPADLAAALDLIATRKINVKDTITQTLPLEQIQAAFKIVAEAKESLKVVLEVN